jgi:hypothetical protein
MVSQIVRVLNTLNITKMPEPTVMRLGMNIMPPEAIPSGVLHKSLPSVIPTLQPPKCFIDFVTLKCSFCLSYQLLQFQ